MGFLRLIIFGLLAYAIYRLIKGPWKESRPRVKSGLTETKPDPFRGADIQDVPYVEVPPDEEGDEGSKKGA